MQKKAETGNKNWWKITEGKVIYYGSKKLSNLNCIIVNTSIRKKRKQKTKDKYLQEFDFLSTQISNNH